MAVAPVTVGPQASVAEVARVMRDEGIGAVLVAKGDELRGRSPTGIWRCGSWRGRAARRTTALPMPAATS
ncbi:hypothetical protein AB0P36_31245 [Streptomyces flavidovirens]|uniref:hypothetical protein n=1 Tax=Streptomyces flavidovirens TaxID=67298 RepID=UPI00343EC421